MLVLICFWLRLSFFLRDFFLFCFFFRLAFFRFLFRRGRFIGLVHCHLRANILRTTLSITNWFDLTERSVS